jgi:hypothetical protein
MLNAIIFINNLKHFKSWQSPEIIW